MLFLGIRREDRFSPNRISNDKAIFDAVCSRLSSSDNMLFKMHESEFALDGVDDASMFDAVFHSCRSDKALAHLEQIEKNGVPVVNSPSAVINCRRANQVRLLSGSDTAFVKGRVVDSGHFPDDWDCFPCWLKRGDTHALEADDVRFAADRTEAVEIMKGILAKGSGEVVIQEHVSGKIIKFYGVGDGLLFRYKFLENLSEGKFGLESHNEFGVADIDDDMFRTEVIRIAEKLGVDAYGGDAVATPDGSLVIVDFNDWPSYFMCRNEAAEAIAEVILRKCQR